MPHKSQFIISDTSEEKKLKT